MSTIRHYQQIFNAIIVSYVVHMVYSLIFIQYSAEMLFHYMFMFSVIPIIGSMWMFWHLDISIPHSHNKWFSLGNPRTFFTTIKPLYIRVRHYEGGVANITYACFSFVGKSFFLFVCAFFATKFVGMGRVSHSDFSTFWAFNFNHSLVYHNGN